MSFRFRKSFKIAPGVRLNVGKSSLSISAGVRGARITTGTRGTRMTVGIPGSGLSYSTHLDSSVPMTRAQSNAEIRKQHKEQMMHLAQQDIDWERKQYERFTKIASFSPELISYDDWQEALKPRDFDPEIYGEEIPDLSNIKKFHLKEASKGFYKTWYFWGMIANIFSFFMIALASGKPGSIAAFFGGICLLSFVVTPLMGLRWYLKHRKIAVAKAIENYQENLDRIEKLRHKHPEFDQERIALLRDVYKGNTDYIEKQLSKEFENLSESLLSLAHGFETNISFDIIDARTIMIDLDLPEIKDVVKSEQKVLLKSGRISEKSKTKKSQNQEYAEGVLGLAFCIASHTFNITPSIKEVTVSGYTQRTNRKTGNLGDDYIYSIRFTRDALELMNLREVDPVISVHNFHCNLALSKTFEFKTIQPFGIEIYKVTG